MPGARGPGTPDSSGGTRRALSSTGFEDNMTCKTRKRCPASQTIAFWLCPCLTFRRPTGPSSPATRRFCSASRTIPPCACATSAIRSGSPSAPPTASSASSSPTATCHASARAGATTTRCDRSCRCPIPWRAIRRWATFSRSSRATRHRRNDVAAVGIECGVHGVVHQVDVELVDAEALELAQLGDVVVDGAQDAEALDDLVGDELGVGVADTPVMGVVVALARLDVVGQRPGDVAPLAVALDDVGHVVADHPAEPAALLARVVEVVADIGRRRDADGDRIGVAPGLLGGLADLLHG